MTQPSGSTELTWNVVRDQARLTALMALLIVHPPGMLGRVRDYAIIRLGAKAGLR